MRPTMAQSEIVGSSSSPSAPQKPKPNPSANINVWIHYIKDTNSTLSANPNVLDFYDTIGDQNYRIAVCDVQNGKSVKILKGQGIEKEIQVDFEPLALKSFASKTGRKGAISTLAVGVGNTILFIEGGQTNRKFLLPEDEIDKEEIIIWQTFDGVNMKDFLLSLNELKKKGIQLSYRSFDLLLTDNLEEQEALYEKWKRVPFKVLDNVTCMASIQQSSDPGALLSCLMVGTEKRKLYLFDKSGQNIFQCTELPETPVFIVTFGALQGDHYAFVALRSPRICVVKAGKVLQTLETESRICAMARSDKALFVGGTDQSVGVYSIRGGKKVYSLSQPSALTSLEAFELPKNTSMKYLLVGLANHELRVYVEKTLIHTTNLDDTPVALKFGSFNGVDVSLVIVYKLQGHEIRLLNKSYETSLNSLAASRLKELLPGQLEVPKKTILALEQAEREKEQGPMILRNYQKDVLKLRIKTSETYLKVLNLGYVATGSDSKASLKIHAQVDGLGPMFKIFLTVTNDGVAPVTNVQVGFSYSMSIYRMVSAPSVLPMLVPNFSYVFPVSVENISQNGVADSIKVFLTLPGSSAPAIGAIIKLPIAEASID